MATTPLIDWHVIRELIGVTADSGGTFMVQLMQTFVSDAQDALARMQTHAQAGDAVALAREAHRLKGSSGTVGAIQLAGECFAIEHQARAGSCTGLDSRIDHARQVLDATRRRMAEFFRGTIATAT